MSQGSASVPPRSSRTSVAAKKQKQKKKRPVLRIFLVLLLGLLLLAAAAVAYLLDKTTDALDQIGVDNDTVIVPVGESVKEKPFAMVLMGIDTRPPGVKAGGMNTDVMMVSVFNPTTRKVTVVSIPRDSKIDVEGYRARKANAFYADFYTVALRENKDKDKAKAAIEGKKAVREVMGKLFGIDIKYAALINFQGFVDVVDALGGVQVDVDMRMKYTDSHDGTNINLEKGLQPLNGNQALDFVRYRQSNDGKNMSSDFDRNKRQGVVLGALVDKMMTFGGVTKLGSVIEALGNNMKLDMPQSEIRHMLTTYYNVRRDDITFITLEGNWRSPYVHLNNESLEAARAALQANMAE